MTPAPPESRTHTGVFVEAIRLRIDRNQKTDEQTLAPSLVGIELADSKAQSCVGHADHLHSEDVGVVELNAVKLSDLREDKCAPKQTSASHGRSPGCRVPGWVSELPSSPTSLRPALN